MAKGLKASSIVTKLERRATLYCRHQGNCWVLKIADILHKMAARWPCDCFIQNQNSHKASGARFEYPTNQRLAAGFLM
jgi:hypothetical protein